MISYLEGKIAEINRDRIVIDVGGIGYEVFVPAGVLSDIRLLDTIKLYTVHVFREDGQLLFGFAQKEEKEGFKRLTSVSGVGPKIGLSIMSSLPLPKIMEGIAAGDANLFTRVPGIGKKLSQRIILELKDKIGDLMGDFVLSDYSAATELNPAIKDDTTSALASLGYASREIQKAIQNLTTVELKAINSTEDSIRIVLQKMR